MSEPMSVTLCMRGCRLKVLVCVSRNLLLFLQLVVYMLNLLLPDFRKNVLIFNYLGEVFTLTLGFSQL